MSHIIQCRMQPSPEALERILQVVRIRGFMIQGMKVELDEELEIDLRLSGERSIENLVRQLEKLVGMIAVHSLSTVSSRGAVMAASA